MEKKLIFILLFTAIANCTNAQLVLNINGEAPTLKDGTILSLAQIYPRGPLFKKIPPLQAIVKSGHFTYTLSIAGGEEYFLSYHKNEARMFLAPGSATIKIPDSTLKNTKVFGNQAASEFVSFYEALNHDTVVRNWAEAMREYYATDNHTDTAFWNIRYNKLKTLKALLKQQQMKLGVQWIKDHPQSYLNTEILYYNVLNTLPEAEFRSLFQSLPQNVKNNSWGTELAYMCDGLFIGSKAPGFIQPDTNGQPVSLASYKGKYILVDFWASWCIPCRANNPYLVKVMEKFRNKNFAMLGISLDSEKKPWLYAIKKDRLSWMQLSDLKQWHNQVSSAYCVRSIPNNFLINPDGIIIAKNISGEDLDKTLTNLVK